MLPKVAWIIVIAYCLAVALVPWLVSSAPPGVTQTAAPPSKGASVWEIGQARAELLRQNGYIDVPLLPSNRGYLGVVAEVDGESTFFYLDTGSTDSVLDAGLAERRKLPTQPSERAMTGVGGATKTLPMFVAKSFAVGGLKKDFHALINDLSNINKVILERNDPREDGLLGMDFLGPLAPVVDYGAARLFLQADSTKVRSASPLANLLKSQKYQELPLNRNKMGIMEITTVDQGERLNWQIDTAAMSSTFDVAVAARLKLPLEDTTMTIRGFGDDVAKVKIARINLPIGYMQLPHTVIVHDLATLNGASLREGGTKWAGILGALFSCR